MMHSNQKKFNELMMQLALHNTIFKWYSLLGGNDGVCIELAIKARKIGTKNENPVDVYLGRIKPDEMVERGTRLLEQKEEMLREVRTRFEMDLSA